MMVDGGLPTRSFQDIVESGAEYLDFVKFGWGTAIVTNDLRRKIDVLADAGVDYYFGGTLFEKFVLQDRFDDFRDLCQSYSLPLRRGLQRHHQPVGHGEGRLHHEAGRRLPASSPRWGSRTPSAPSASRPTAGSRTSTTTSTPGRSWSRSEARESGRSGICRPNGELRFGLIEEILASDVPVERLLFEAPSTELQCYFVRRVGTDVNLGNIPSTAILGLETIRLGLRSDTLECFEAKVS